MYCEGVIGVYYEGFIGVYYAGFLGVYCEGFLGVYCEGYQALTIHSTIHSQYKVLQAAAQALQPPHAPLSSLAD